jgi:2-dehydro-3-deoxygluconokinase
MSTDVLNLLGLKPSGSCSFDLIALGEIMLRMDPGEGRIRCSREFKVWEGGAEYNVARGLCRCFGLRTAICTAFADNEIGRLLEDFVLQGGVDTRFIKWAPFDGVGRLTRNGLNFTERGFGVRGAIGVSDRGHSAASQLKVGDFDWEDIFGRQGARWFHTGGIFAALSDSTMELAMEAVRAARMHGVLVSYDLNYRPSLWQSIGGQARACEVNREIARHVDVMLGNEEDFTTCLGLEIEGADENLLKLEIAGFRKMMETAVKLYPNLKVVATTLRAAKSATVNDWSAVCWTKDRFCESSRYVDLQILDRVGGGDSFASGLIYGLMETGDPQKAVGYGAAHGALAMTTPGDNSTASRAEVERLSQGGGARIQR